MIRLSGEEIRRVKEEYDTRVVQEPVHAKHIGDFLIYPNFKGKCGIIRLMCLKYYLATV
jgi:hypothetical protein